MRSKQYVAGLGALTGHQAVQQVAAGLEAIYLSGWQLASDTEAGFGGNLNAFELMKSMIEAGPAGVHFKYQLSSAKKCGHLGGKVLLPTQEAVNKLIAARLAADVMGVLTVLIARTDAEAANLITSDIDERDQSFLTGERTAEGYYFVNNGLTQCISRGLSYAPQCRLHLDGNL